MRRERMFLELLERLDGIADIMELGLLWMDDITKKDGDRALIVMKEVGDLRDSKTRQRMIDSLLSQGKIKTESRWEDQQMNVKGEPKAPKLRRLVFFPHIDRSKVDEALQKAQKGGAVHTIESSAQHKSALRRVKTHEVATFDAAAIGAMPQKDLNKLIQTLPIEELLNNPKHRKYFTASTLALSQSYGYMAGEMYRLSMVHLHIMQHLDADGTVDVDELLPSLPLSLVVAIKRVERDNSVFKDALLNTELMAKPIGQQDLNVKLALDTVDEVAFRRWFKDDYLLRLEALRLASKVASPSAERWRFKHDSLGDGEISWRGQQGSGAMTSLQDATEYWSKLKEHRDVVAKNMSATGLAIPRLISLMGNNEAWRHDKQVTGRQQLLLKRFVEWPEPDDRGSVLRDEQTLRKISDLCLAPVELIKTAIAGYCKKHEENQAKADAKAKAKAKAKEEEKEKKKREQAEKKTADEEGASEENGERPEKSRKAAGWLQRAGLV